MCGSDEPTKHEPQTRCQKMIIRLQALVFFALAFYTIYSLFNALAQVTRSDLNLQEDPPSDRCVPFFDDIKAYVESDPLKRAVYDYRAGEAITRVCSNDTDSAVRAAIGVQFVYDPWKTVTNCDVLGADRQKFIDNCEMEDFQPNDPMTCEGILNITPLPYGAHWNMFPKLLTGNKTNQTDGSVTPYPPCSIQVTRIPTISPCNQTTMVPFRQVDQNVAILIYIGVAVPFVVTFLQLIALWNYSKTWASADGWMLAFACRGIPGGLYMFYWVCKEGEEGRGEFPDTFFNFWGWLMCAVQDAFEGLVVPLTAILGCRLTRFPLNLALVAVKAIKFVFDFIMYIKDRNETSEPGGQAEQRAVWAQNPDVTAEELKHGVSLEGQDASTQKQKYAQPSFPAPTNYSQTPGMNAV